MSEAAAKTAKSARAPSLALNVLANAAGQLVFVVSGFIVPRLVHDRIGIDVLGVWDFGWAMVAHLMLVGGGMQSAISREVARFPATGDVEQLRRLISSCFALFGGLGVLILGLTAGTAALLPAFLPGLPPEHQETGRLALLLLGGGTSLRFVFHVFNGVITGHQRFVLHNAINSSCYFAGAMAGALLVLTGYGLVAMAAAYLAGEAVAGLLKLVYARRICPAWRIAPGYVRRETLQHVLNFGGKTFLAMISRVLLYQTNAVLVGQYLGPAGLALFSRPRSLVMLLDTLVQRVVSVFAPRCSELDARGDQAGLRHELIRATELSLFTIVPGVLALTLLGGAILKMWMGEAFALGGLVAVLALGHLGILSQRGTYYVLIGMGKHGRPAMFELFAGVTAILLSWALLQWTELGLIGAALAIVVPLAISNWVVLPIYTCGLLKLGVSEFYWRSSQRPLLAAIPVAILFLAWRLANIESTLGLLLVLALGAGIYYAIALRQVLSAEQRARLLRRFTPGFVGGAGQKRFWSEAFLRIAEEAGLNALFAWLTRRQIIILRYHGVVSDDYIGEYAPRGVLRAGDLARQLEAIQRRHRVISLDRAVRILRGEAPPEPNAVVLTFDDGYRNNATVAAPLLERAGARGAFFLTTEFVDGVRPLWFDRLEYALARSQVRALRVDLHGREIALDLSDPGERNGALRRLKRELKRMDTAAVAALLDDLERQAGVRLADAWQSDERFAPMNWDQARALRRGGHVIGCHTRSHQILSVVGRERIAEELDSRVRIEEELAAPCPHFAYPNGDRADISPQTREMLADAGFVSALTTMEGRVRIGDDALELRRLAAGQPVSQAKFLAELSGLLPVLLSWRDCLRRRGGPRAGLAGGLHAVAD